MDQLLVQVDEGGFQAMWGGGGKFGRSMERWEGAGCSGARPFAEGRAPVGDSAPLCMGEGAPLLLT